MAIEHGRHVVMVNVEADALVGPLLARRRRGRGRRLHARLRRSARADLRAGRVGAAERLRGRVRRQGHEAPARPTTRSRPRPCGSTTGCRRSRPRASTPQMFCSFLDGTKSAVEMAAVANATGLVPQAQGLGFPACGTRELAAQLRPAGDGGPLDRSGTLEVVSSLHPDGTPVAGDLRWGVYVTIARRRSLRRRRIRRLRRRDLARRPRRGALAPVAPGRARARRERRARGARGRADGRRAGADREVACRAKRDLRPARRSTARAASTFTAFCRASNAQFGHAADGARPRRAARARRRARRRGQPRGCRTRAIRLRCAASRRARRGAARAESDAAVTHLSCAARSLREIPAGSSPDPLYGFQDHPRQAQIPPVGSVRTDKPRRASCATAPVQRRRPRDALPSPEAMPTPVPPHTPFAEALLFLLLAVFAASGPGSFRAGRQSCRAPRRCSRCTPACRARP